MLKHLVITLFLMGFAAPALADDTSRANELLVEAVQLLQSAEGAADAAEKLRLSEEALGNLNEIVKRYSSTDLAVKLITGQAIGSISLESVAKAVEEARWPACLVSPNYGCAITIILAYAKTKSGEDRAAPYVMMASAQAEVGDIKGAKESIAKVLARAKTKSGDERAGLLALMASAQAEVGDIKGAKESIAETLAYAETEDGKKRAATLTFIASAQAEVGDIKGAKESIAEVLAYVKTASGKERVGLFAFIASAQAEVGDIKGAKESIAEVVSYAETKSGKERVGMLAMIAKALAKME